MEHQAAVVTNESTLVRWKARRLPATFEIPKGWRDERFAWLHSDRRYSPRLSSRVRGRSTFGAKRMFVFLQPHNSAGYLFSYGGQRHLAEPSVVSTGLNNIKTGPIGLIEHFVALWAGLGISMNVVMSAASLPSFANGMGTVLDSVLPHLEDRGGAPVFTVAKPIGVEFGNGAYWILEPDYGSRRLVVDHEIRRDDSDLGWGRVVAHLTPPVFAYLARARTIAWGRRTQFGRALHAVRIPRLPFLALGFDNVVFVGRQRILNPNPRFTLPDGRNIEPIVHEVIDRVAPLGLLPCRFVGTLTTFRTRHALDVLALQLILQHGEFRQVG